MEGGRRLARNGEIALEAARGTALAGKAQMALHPVARLLIGIGIALVLLGLAWQFLPWRPGRLPGDLAWGKGNVRVFLPCGTSILLSLLLTLVLWLLGRFGR